jgi:hypothetical protein
MLPSLADPAKFIPAAAYADVTDTQPPVLIDVWCPAVATPPATPSTDSIRQHAIRLLPKIPVGISPPDNGLVNLEIITWTPTLTHRQLPTAVILGRPVHLKIHFQNATWTYGDNSDPVSTTDLGHAYDSAHDPCHTLQCPNYQGHTYRQPGRFTITQTTTWTASYSLDNHHWTDLTPTITSQPTSHAITIRSAYTHLVP